MVIFTIIGVVVSAIILIVALSKQWDDWVWARTLGPERQWAMPAQGEARGNPGGGPQRCWRANRSSDVGI